MKSMVTLIVLAVLISASHAVRTYGELKSMLDQAVQADPGLKHQLVSLLTSTADKAKDLASDVCVTCTHLMKTGAEVVSDTSKHILGRLLQQSVGINDKVSMDQAFNDLQAVLYGGQSPPPPPSLTINFPRRRISPINIDINGDDSLAKASAYLLIAAAVVSVVGFSSVFARSAKTFFKAATGFAILTILILIAAFITSGLGANGLEAGVIAGIDIAVTVFWVGIIYALQFGAFCIGACMRSLNGQGQGSNGNNGQQGHSIEMPYPTYPTYPTAPPYNQECLNPYIQQNQQNNPYMQQNNPYIQQRPLANNNQ